MRLLKKYSFFWNSESATAFEELKKTMVTVPVLAFLDFYREFIIETDASGKGLGAMLMQEGRPLTFISKALSLQSQNKSVYERELITIVMAFQKWCHYLLEHHFKVQTDQRSLKFLTD